MHGKWNLNPHHSTTLHGGPRWLAAAASFNQPSLGNAVVVHVVGGNSLWQMAKKSWIFPLTSCICCTSAKICGWDWKGVIFTGQGQFSHPTTWWIFKSYRGQLAKSILAFVWNCTTCNVCSCVRKALGGFEDDVSTSIDCHRLAIAVTAVATAAAPNEREWPTKWATNDHHYVAPDSRLWEGKIANTIPRTTFLMAEWMVISLC